MKVPRLWCTLAVVVGFVSAVHGADLFNVPTGGNVVSSKVSASDVVVLRALRPPEAVRTFRAKRVRSDCHSKLPQ